MIVSAEKYLGRDPYVQCNVQKYKESVQTQLTIQNQAGFRQSGFNRQTSIKKNQKQYQEKYEHQFEGSQNNNYPNQQQRNDKPNKNLFVQCETITTETQQYGSNAGQEDQDQTRQGNPPNSNQNQLNNNYKQDKYGNKLNDEVKLNQSSELKSGVLDNNIKTNESVRHSQSHKFKREVDKKNANQLVMGQIENNNLLQINNQNNILTNPSPVFPQNSFRVQPLTLNNYEKNRQQEIEVNVSLETKTKWVIKSFCEVLTDEEIVWINIIKILFNQNSYGDKLWLHHLETANNLVTQRNLTMKEEENKKTHTDFENKIDLNRLRQCIKFETTTIKENTFIKQSGNTKGMWILERNEKLKGGQAEFNQIVYFKHFSTRKYLQLEHQFIDKGNNSSCKIIQFLDFFKQKNMWLNLMIIHL